MIQRAVEPAKEPVTLSEAKAQCRVDTNDDDSYITSLIKASRRICEGYTHMSFYTQTWDMILDQAPPVIDLYQPPVQSVTSVYVTDDDDGNETIVPSSIYRVDLIRQPGRLILKPGQSWPSHTRVSGFRIRYVAGYDDPAKIPEDLKLAVKMLVAYLYDNPGNTRGTITFAGQQGQLPDDVRMLLDPFQVVL